MDQTNALSPPSGIYAHALNKIRQGLCAFDHQQRLLLFNTQYAEMYGIAPEALRLGMTLRDVIDLRYSAGTGPKMSQDEYAIWRDRIAIEDKVVETIVELRNGRVHEIHHEPTEGGGWVATIDDITERRLSEQLLMHMARHDGLTSLPNRHVFNERLAIALAQTGRGDRIAVLCLDLDRFKPVNDTFGHSVGDLLLRSVADRIRSQTRQGDTAVRLGGDEFVILQTGLTHLSDAESWQRGFSHHSRAHDIEGHKIEIGRASESPSRPLMDALRHVAETC